MLLLYIFLSLFVAALVMSRIKLDPLLVVMPSVLLLPVSVGALLSVYISLLPVMLLLAVYGVLRARQDLDVESLTRLGAGLSLGAFIALQLLVLLPFTLSMLITMVGVFSALGLVVLLAIQSPVMKLSRGFQLWVGLLTGIVQHIGFGSGRALLGVMSPSELDANHNALWAFGLVGALIGWLALPPEAAVTPQFDMMIFSVALLAALGGLLLARRIKISVFESNVLRWIVVLLCLSFWVHIGIKLFIFTS